MFVVFLLGTFNANKSLNFWICTYCTNLDLHQGDQIIRQYYLPLAFSHRISNTAGLERSSPWLGHFWKYLKVMWQLRANLGIEETERPFPSLSCGHVKLQQILNSKIFKCATLINDPFEFDHFTSSNFPQPLKLRKILHHACRGKVMLSTNLLYHRTWYCCQRSDSVQNQKTQNKPHLLNDLYS